ncbi:MAG: FAD-dependent thymidylate synthase [bacterium]
MKTVIVKPKIWNFEMDKEAWKEVVYSGRVSGIPSQVADDFIFKMIVNNDYGSTLEHIIIKFDLKMSKGNAPELLEHRMMSHTGYSTRYIKASEGIDKRESSYEIILPWHLLKLDKEHPARQEFKKAVQQGIESYEKLLEIKIPRESARYTLPFCQAVGIYHITINLRSLLNLLSLRLCVRTSPEFRCLAAQLYFSLLKSFPAIDGYLGCRGMTKGLCPENGVTGVRTGEQSRIYPPCLFKNKQSDVYIPTAEELRQGINYSKISKEKIIKAQEAYFSQWAKWEG